MFRKFFMTIHTLIATFILPSVLLFIITGSFYTWGEKGDYEITKYSFQGDLQLEWSEEGIVQMARTFLQEKQLDEPSGELSVRFNQDSGRLSWSGSAADVSLTVNKNDRNAELEYRKATLFKRFVQLHKAKGGNAFKVYATVMAIGLLLLSISGYVLALQLKAYRRMTLITSVVGILFFIVLVLIS